MYQPSETRYSSMSYRRCGFSGIKLPAVSLGLWQNFGSSDPFERSKKIVLSAFDSGITHFDLANNYGPPPGSAELTFGRILKEDLYKWRDELIISTKAGYLMWPGPYGDCGSRKYLMSSLDQSLKRLGIEYVDIFYSHRPDPETPLEETMNALSDAVRQGKALYAGISNYPADKAGRALEILRENHTPCLIHQPRYNMLNREPEKALFKLLKEEGVGCITFSPLAQGLLSGKYLDGIPQASRIGRGSQFLKKDAVSDKLLGTLRKLHSIASSRGQTLAQMALSWILRHQEVTSVLTGASSPEQVIENISAVSKTGFSTEELDAIDAALASGI